MKKVLFILSACSLFTAPTVVLAENSLQEHLRLEQKLKEQEQKKLKDGSGEKKMYQYKKEHQYQGTSSNRSMMGSMGGQKGGGGGRN